jgi:drug/metabolite transporter (DMT)-like permease
MTARLQLLAAALLFSTGGAAVKATILSNWQVAGLRSAIAAAVLWLASPGIGRLTWRVWLVGLAYGITLVTFVTANKLTTAANAVFLQAAAPLYLMAAGPWLGERVRRRDLPFMLVTAAGLVLLFAGGGATSVTAPNRPLGNLIGAMSGVTWAVTIAGLRWVEGRRTEGVTAAGATVCGNVLAALACLPLALPMDEARLADWLTVGYLGVFQVGLAYVLVTRAIGHVTAVEASLLLLLEPASSPFWAWLVHDEHPGLLALAGGAIIVGATTVRSLRRAGSSAGEGA